MADIGAELLEKIRAEFQKNCKADKYIQSVLKKIEGSTAKMEEVALLSKQLGLRASQAIGTYVNAGALPDGKMYYNIADTILTGVLKDNYDIINSAVAACQKALDNQAGIHIRPQQAEFPTERIQAVANAASIPDIAEEVMIRRMTSPTQNITESFYNDYVEANVKFRSDTGLDCYIIRNDHGGCCEWCAKLAGKYHYPEDVPKDVYRRHDNCGCTVTYLNGKKAQNVWDKTKWNVSDEELERMKKAGAREPIRLKNKVVTKEPIRLVDKSVKSDIIKSKKCEIAPDKINKFFLKPNAKHSREFFDVGYKPTDFELLNKDLKACFDYSKAVDKVVSDNGVERFSIFTELGVNEKKRFRTVWQKDTPESIPRIITAHREDER